MDESLKGSTARAPEAETLSLDDRIKHAQLLKLTEEVRGLRRSTWNLDTLSKILIPILAVATAVWAFLLGLPQAKMDTYEAQKKLSEAQGDVRRKADELADVEGRLDTAKAEVSKLEDARKLNQESIRDLEALKVATAADVTRLQELLRQLKTDNPGLKIAVSAATRQSIFIQFAGSLERQKIDALRGALSKVGFDTPPAVRRNSGQPNEIRYLSSLPNGAAVADEAKKIVEEHFKRSGCPLPSLAVRRLESATSSGVPLELLLLHNCS